jgi:hypothetical protein
MPAERGPGTVLRDERMLDIAGGDAEPLRGPRSQRLEEIRDRRRRVDGVVREVVVEAL